MSDSTEIARIGRIIDRFAAACDPSLLQSVASTRATDHGVPPEMWASPVDPSGWVTWRVMPSTLDSRDIDALERRFSITFPPTFRSYLLARHQCFDQILSRRYDQAIMFPDLPTREPLRALRESLDAWCILLRAKLIPFAEWGDGWGPICFDTESSRSDGEYPILWLDHEQVIPLGEKATDRNALRQFEKPLYTSFGEMLEDVFGNPVE